jgi:hypothetical protein
MSVIKIISYVSNSNNGLWNIKLTDTFENISVICNDITEYKEKLQDMASDYGNDIEVIWERAKDLSPKNIEFIQNEMLKLQEEYKDEIKNINEQNQVDTNMQNGLNSNA